MVRFSRWMLALAAAASVWSVRAETIAVAVASNFSAPLAEIAREFERETGHKLQVSSASTGKLYAQIDNGAPFDVFLSADRATPERLVEQGLAQASSRLTYARGRLVLWSAWGDRVDEAAEVLKDSSWRHLSIANPKVAPYGQAAVQAIEHMGLGSTVMPRVVRGENVGQAYQYVANGSVELGFVAMAQVWRDGRWVSGSGWLVPQEWHGPIDQDAVVLTRAAANPAVAEFMQWLRGKRTRAVLYRFGYEAPCSEPDRQGLAC